MRVFYSFGGRFGRTGIGETAWQQVCGLAAAGCRVTVACGSCERPVPPAVEMVETFRPAGFKIPYRFLGIDLMYGIHDRIVSRMLARRAGQFDVVHCWPLAAEQTLRRARRIGIPSFLERPNTHSGYAIEVVAAEARRLGLHVDEENSHRLRPGRLAREIREYETADWIMCPSDFVASTFVNRGFPASKILRHQYGFDPQRFFQQSGAVRALRESDVVEFIFAGRCEPRKGLHHLLHAWEQARVGRRARLRIVGKYVDGYREKMPELLRAESVVECGFVSDVERLMRDSHVLVLPSIEEGSALVTYEAMASGCALLVSDATGAPVVHGQSGLVHPVGDVARLAAQIADVVKVPELLLSLRTGALNESARLTWSDAAVRLRGCYEEAAARVRAV